MSHIEFICLNILLLTRNFDCLFTFGPTIMNIHMSMCICMFIILSVHSPHSYSINISTRRQQQQLHNSFPFLCVSRKENKIAFKNKIESSLNSFVYFLSSTISNFECYLIYVVGPRTTSNHLTTYRKKNNNLLSIV